MLSKLSVDQALKLSSENLDLLELSNIIVWDVSVLALLFLLTSRTYLFLKEITSFSRNIICLFTMDLPNSGVLDGIGFYLMNRWGNFA